MGYGVSTTALIYAGIVLLEIFLMIKVVRIFANVMIIAILGLTVLSPIILEATGISMGDMLFAYTLFAGVIGVILTVPLWSASSIMTGISQKHDIAELKKEIEELKEKTNQSETFK
jgi:hypothetical protein